MNNHDAMPLDERAAALRRAFDQAFAAAPNDTTKSMQAFLAIGVGDDHYALHLSEIAGLFADKKVIPLPSHAPDLLGIATFRGALVPVYDLRTMLGYPAGAAPRWLILVRQETPIGLAFDQLDGYLDLPLEAIAPTQATERPRQYLTETLSADGLTRPVVSVSAILDTIRKRVQANNSVEK